MQSVISGGGERKRDIHFLHSVGFKICFLKFILNIAGSRKKKLLLWLWSCGIASVGLSHQPGWTDTLPPSSSLQGTLLPKSNTPNPTTAFQATSPPSQTLKTPKIYTISKLQPIQPLFIHIYPPPALEGMTQSLRAELASVQSPSSPRLQQSSSWQAHRCASTAGYGSPLPRRTERIISPPAKHQLTTSLFGCSIPATDRFPRAETLEELEHMGSELIQCFGKNLEQHLPWLLAKPLAAGANPTAVPALLSMSTSPLAALISPLPSAQEHCPAPSHPHFSSLNLTAEEHSRTVGTNSAGLGAGCEPQRLQN